MNLDQHRNATAEAPSRGGQTRRNQLGIFFSAFFLRVSVAPRLHSSSISSRRTLLHPRPVHKVYCHDGFKRTNLTPPLGIESVEAYTRSDEGHKALVNSVTALLTERVNLRLDQTAIFGPQPLIAGPPPGGYKILTVSGEQLGK